MNIKNYIDITVLNIFRDKKKKYLILIMVICTILALSVLTFKSIFFEYINDNINKNIGFRIINVVPKLDDDDYGLSEIQKIEHINDIYSSQYSSVYVESSFANEKLSGGIELIYGEKTSLPNNIIGKSFEDSDKYVAICPIDFYPDNSVYDIKIKEKNIIDGTKLLDTFFTIKYYSYSFNGAKKKIESEHKKTFKIIGLYDSKKVMNFSNQCYAPYKVIKEIVDDEIIGGINPTIYAFSIIVDSSQNVEFVKEKLETAGFTGIRQKNQIDQKLVNIIIISCNVIVALVLFTVIILVVSYTKKKILGESKKIGVLRTIGYNKTTVRNLYLLEIMISNFLSYIIGIIIFAIIYLILKNYALQYLSYFGIKIKITTFNLIYVFFIIVLITTIIANYYIIKKINLKIIDLIGNEE